MTEFPKKNRETAKSPVRQEKEEDLRAAALEVLLEVLEKKEFCHLALRRSLKAHAGYEKRQRAFFTRLVEGTVERCLESDYIIDWYSSTPVRKMKPVIRTILRMSVYQIIYMDGTQDAAVCNEAVRLTAKRGFAGLKGFVNGLLRRIVSEKDRLPYPPEDTPEGMSVRSSTPLWIVQKWQAVYGISRTGQMLSALTGERPLIVHMNLSAEEEGTITASLREQGVRTAAHPYSREALCLEHVDRLEELTAFRNGWIQVQDISSQIASHLALQALRNVWQNENGREIRGFRENGEENGASRKNQKTSGILHVLDVCAAPGGKSIYVAQGASRLGMPVQITARDLTEQKAEQIRENCRRLRLPGIDTEVWDARRPDPDREQSADLLIADLPCSGLGIMARKNDIKYRMTEDAQKELAVLQRQILSVVWRYVKPGGYLLYSTCTINTGENEENRDWLSQQFPLEPVEIAGWLEELDGDMREKAGQGLAEDMREKAGQGWAEDMREGGLQALAGDIQGNSLQLLPGIHDSDGFFVSVFRRRDG